MKKCRSRMAKPLEPSTKKSRIVIEFMWMNLFSRNESNFYFFPHIPRKDILLLISVYRVKTEGEKMEMLEKVCYKTETFYTRKCLVKAHPWRTDCGNKGAFAV